MLLLRVCGVGAGATGGLVELVPGLQVLGTAVTGAWTNTVTFSDVLYVGIHIDDIDLNRTRSLAGTDGDGVCDTVTGIVNGGDE